jgi:hypothetical protein
LISQIWREKKKKKKKKPWCQLRLCKLSNKNISDKKIEKILEIFVSLYVINLANFSHKKAKHFSFSFEKVVKFLTSQI